MRLISPRKGVWLLFSTLLTISLVLSGCGGNGSPTPTTTTPKPTSTTPTGQLTFPQGKYQHNDLYENVLMVAYSNDFDTISVGIKVKTIGWVAIALSPMLSKNGSDLWIFAVAADGTVTAIDSHDPGYGGGHPSDSPYGTDDLFDITGNEVNGVTTIEFKRLINTGDTRDVRIVEGPNPFLFAFGSTDNIYEEHNYIGFGTITAEKIGHDN
ncbi:MAG: hypothetical protein E4H31_02720 [Dehalococcoidia bacterium]|nr:MAG: hypothetical protein E4H31_02720 [Dehalococcoidia bacterium]